MSIQSTIPEELAHEIGQKWVAGGVLSHLAEQYQINYFRLRARLARMGYEVGQGQRGNGQRGTGAALSDEADFRIREREMRNAEALWAALNPRFEDARVPAEGGRLPSRTTYVPQASSLENPRA